MTSCSMTSYPIILPYSCRLSRLLVQFRPQISLHGGSQLMARLIRSKYWFPKVKNLVRAVITSCKTCTIFKKRLQTQLMCDMPIGRVSFSRPFTYSGDKKIYKASIPHYQRVRCDNAKTFVGAATLIFRDFMRAVQESVTDTYSHQGLVWRFITPGAPHMEGWGEKFKNSFLQIHWHPQIYFQGALHAFIQDQRLREC